MLLRKGMRGESVRQLQTRLTELGFLNSKIDGVFGPVTQNAVMNFQMQANLGVDGIVGPKTEAALNDVNAPHYVVPTSTAVPATGTAQMMDWWKSDISKIFARGVVATITDVDTGLAWHEVRKGGSNHADVQPCTAADTAVLKQAYGGKWSWARRAIFVTINGVNYAASMNGMPHSGQSILDNNFPGHHCIHFTNSRTHNTNKVCPDHRKAIEKAARANLGDNSVG